MPLVFLTPDGFDRLAQLQHRKALVLDATANYGAFNLLASYVALRCGAAANNFDFAKLSYSSLGRLTPFVPYHKWRDRSEQQGDYDGATLGLNYRLSPVLKLETAYTTSPDQNVQWHSFQWAQLHWVREW